MIKFLDRIGTKLNVTVRLDFKPKETEYIYFITFIYITLFII